MAKVNSFGTLVQHEDPNNAGTFITIGQIGDVSGPSRSRSDNQVTTHDSADGYHEYLAGLKEGGTVEFDIQFDPDDTAGQAFLTTSFEAGKATNWRLVFPNSAASRFEYAGYVNNLPVDAPVDGSLTSSVGIKVTGKPTFVASPA